MPPDARSRPTPQQGGSQNLNQDQLTPYARAWPTYLAVGWRGPIPIRRFWRGKPSNGKFPPVGGFTGRHNAGTWPTVEQMRTWAAQPHEFGNIALRLPDDVIGLDVDQYAGKRGGDTIHEHVTRFGGLPETWSSSGRPPGAA